MANHPQLRHQAVAVAEQAVGHAHAWSRAAVATMELSLLRWAVGWFCAAVGALMLVVPHQFSSPSFSFIRPSLLWVGVIFLLAGVSLLVATVAGAERRLRLLAHLACGGVLFFYAYALLRTATFAGGLAYLPLSLGIVAAGLIPAGRGGAATSGDLFGFLIGFCAVGLGVSMLVTPEQFRSAIYDPIKPWMLQFGLTYLLGGSVLTLVHLRRPRSALLFWLPHAIIGATFLTYMLLVSVPNRGITGILFYGGFGSLLIALPVAGPAIGRFDASLLRVRLGMFFVITAAIPLTIMVALITAQQERIAIEQLLSGRRVLAVTISQEIEDYVELHTRAVSALAADPQLRSADQTEQRAALVRFNEAFPQFFVCSRFDADARGLVRSDALPLTTMVGAPVFERVRSTGQPAVELRSAQSIQRPVLSFVSPVRGLGGAFAGAAVCGLETTRLSTLISQLAAAGQQDVYLIDDAGRAIASSDPEIAALADLSASEAVQATRSGEPLGSLRYGDPPREQLAGYALIPTLGWGVVVERGVADDLGAVRGARELAFGLLAVAVVIAAAAGVLVASYLTAPLDSLAVAVRRFAAGDAGAPLPQEGVSEVAQVAAAVDRMRRDLSAAAADREQAITQRDTFFSVAAHELKTPLTALLGQAQLARRRAERDGELSEKNRRSLDVVVAQAQRLNALITDLLDISRLQQGRLALARAPLDLIDLVGRVVEEIQPTLEHHQIRCEVTGDGGPAMIDGDEMRLEQVLHNLISNAVKYSPDGGVVVVRVAREGPYVRVAVTDSGIGIPSEAVPYLFERFYRAANFDQRQIGGMGVGLFVVREIVALHGGRIEVASAEGRGSVFTIVLPLAAG